MAHQYPNEYGDHYQTDARNSMNQPLPQQPSPQQHSPPTSSEPLRGQARRDPHPQDPLVASGTATVPFSSTAAMVNPTFAGAPYPSSYQLPRSNPIAIRRNRTNNTSNLSHIDTSDEDDDEEDDFDKQDDILLGEDGVLDVERDARKLASRRNNSQSLPSRLLRAPFLGSVPINDDYLMYQNMLPPPMA